MSRPSPGRTVGRILSGSRDVVAPPRGLEPRHPPPEGGALSAELWGLNLMLQTAITQYRPECRKNLLDPHLPRWYRPSSSVVSALLVRSSFTRLERHGRFHGVDTAHLPPVLWQGGSMTHMHVAGSVHADVASPSPTWLTVPADVNSLDRELWSTTVTLSLIHISEPTRPY